MSDTPRTDLETVEGMGCATYPEWKDSVDANFARQLERELAGFCRELDASPNLEPSGQVVDAMVRLTRMKRDLAAVTAERDRIAADNARLRDALRLIVHDGREGASGGWCAEQARAALADADGGGTPLKSKTRNPFTFATWWKAHGRHCACNPEVTPRILAAEAWEASRQNDVRIPNAVRRPDGGGKGGA